MQLQTPQELLLLLQNAQSLAQSHGLFHLQLEQSQFGHSFRPQQQLSLQPLTMESGVIALSLEQLHSPFQPSPAHGLMLLQALLQLLLQLLQPLLQQQSLLAQPSLVLKLSLLVS